MRTDRSSRKSQHLPTVDESNNRQSSNVLDKAISPLKTAEVKKFVSYQEHRNEIESQLKTILSAIVTRAHEIQAQIEFIKASGWNWLEPTEYLPGS